MTLDETSQNKAASRRHLTAKLVAIPSIPGLVRQGPTSEAPRHELLPSLPSPAAPDVSQDDGLKSQQSNQMDTSSTVEAVTHLPLATGITSTRPEASFDVYARVYVLVGLRVINEETPRSITHTATRHKIAFKPYISKFAGQDFVRPLLPGRCDDPHGDPVPAMVLTEQTYAQYFTSLLRREGEAKERENEQHALYAVPLETISTTGTRLWSLSVPGLREDSPLIEMGDTLQIRQLWVDFTGSPIKVPISQVNTPIPYTIYKSWTEMQYNASVYSVTRIDETVYVRADGLTHLFLFDERHVVPMIVNVVFPPKQELVQNQREAILRIGQRLEEGLQDHEQATSAFDDFSRSSFDLEASSTLSDSVPNPLNDWIRRMLFPRVDDGRLQTKLRKVPHRELFDHAINYEQAHAVNSVCTVDYGTLPYLVSGPPGTGKTKTLVELAMQLLRTTDVAHILICAPSEAAADTLALRLKHYLTPNQLLRLNRPNRADNEVPRELLQYCYMQNDMFYLPPFRVLMSFRILVTSCRDASILTEARLTNADLWTLERDSISAFHPENDPPTPSLHWGALLLDEAAQATEVDVLPAISVVCPPSAYPREHVQPRVVMAGDEHQLGPRTASHDPKFDTSLFARLASRSMFANHPLSRRNVDPSSGPPVLKRSMLPIMYPPFTNLIRNYRSHPAILSVPSAHFYRDTLIPDAVISNTPLTTSTLWRGRKWPVLYIPHTGPDEIERDNGGWYNMSEARLACSLAQKLVLKSGVRQSDICIMSPFAAQVKLLRSLIRSRDYAGGAGLWEVNIGPVEAFQGLEKRVVIICTTRTRMRFVADDVTSGMGLVGQKRKMNVALTRATEGLFVIGSPEVLGADEHWRVWMAFCGRNGLVDDDQGVWKDREEFKEGSVGVLERALIAKEDWKREKQWPALGAAAADYDIDGDEYEAWTESLRQALDREEGEEDEEDSEEDNGSESH